MNENGEGVGLSWVCPYERPGARPVGHVRRQSVDEENFAAQGTSLPSLLRTCFASDCHGVRNRVIDVDGWQVSIDSGR